ANFGNTTYDWDNMPGTVTVASPYAEQLATATLMYHCGVSVNMMYGTSASSAYSEDVPYALESYFGYTTSGILYKSNYSNSGWISLLKNELDAYRPIYYCGSGIYGGHAFVCDGYDSDNKFHFNWGWSGNANGYFAIGNLNPNNFIFNSNNAAILIEPVAGIIDAPTNLMAEVNGKEVSLSWTGVGGATSYKVYRNNVLIASDVTNLDYTDSDVSYGSHYYFVKAVNSSGTSGRSNIASADVIYWGPVPQNFTGSASGSSAVLSWTAPTGGDGQLNYGTTPQYITTTQYFGEKFPVSMLEQYEGMAVYKVSVFFYQTGSYQLFLTQGDDFPGTSICSSIDFAVTSQGWKDITLSEPAYYNPSLPLLVYIKAPSATYQVVLCEYADSDEGCYYSDNGTSWFTFNGGGSTYSWLIKLFVTSGDYTYNIYRNSVKIASSISATTYTDSGLSSGTYNYYATTNFYGGESGASNTATVAIGGGGTHTVTVSANPSAGGIVTGGGTYNHGATATLTATANTGYTFISWTKNGTVVSNNPTYSFTVTENARYVANFELNSYIITATANPTEGGTVTGAGTYNHGATCTLTATANTGYTFINWKKNGTVVSNNPTYSFTVTGDANYVANLELNSYTITATANPTEGGTITGAGTYNHGATATLTATANEGYAFMSWNENGVAVSYNATYSFVVTEEHNLVAIFVAPSMNTLSIGDYTGTEGEIITININLANENEVASFGFDIPINEGFTYVEGSLVKGVRCGPNFVILGQIVSSGALRVLCYSIPGTNISGNDGVIASLQILLGETGTYELSLTNESLSNTQGGTIPCIVVGGSLTVEETISIFDITVTANPTQGGTVTGGGTYDYGTSVTIVATANTGYTFINWTNNGTVVSTNPTYCFIVTEDASYVANFELNSYTITVTANPVEGGTVTGAGTYNHGATATLTAIAITGYNFINWTKNGTVVSAYPTYSFTVTEDASYVANFELNSYTITITANPMEGGTVTGAGTYNHGATATLTATANTGYTFINWTEDGTIVSTNPTYSFTVTEDASYVANFESNSYTITVTADPADGGTVTGAGTYDHGATATLTATANTGYTFINWTEDGTVVSTEQTYSFSVTEDASYVANFELKSYTITATAEPTEGGTVTGAGIYNHGATCTLTATANTGYTFINWTKHGRVVSTNPTYSFTVTRNASFVANFELNSYTITATADPIEGGTITGAGIYNHGATATLTATANTGYNFINWTNNGTIISTNPTYSFTVTEDADLVANFEAEVGLPGDANGDGMVNALDIVIIINHIFGETPEEFVFANADVNGDGVVDALDIVVIINLIFSK
ncbi:MAG: C10 family peptidase, partial [Bacteroidales bacterium]|nr:C10 family peptidase [Bacteroidales bacterium]